MNLAQTLIADPTFSLMTRAEKIDEAVAIMRSADPETEPDDFEAALAVEEAEALLEAGLPAADAPSPTGTGPEPCREDRASCASPVAGNGRCLECGARRAAETPAPAEPVKETPKSQHVAPVSAKPQPPLLGRFKAATGSTDRDLGDMLNMARSTVQATSSGRMPEKLTPKQLTALAKAVARQVETLENLRSEIEDRAV